MHILHSQSLLCKSENWNFLRSILIWNRTIISIYGHATQQYGLPCNHMGYHQTLFSATTGRSRIKITIPPHNLLLLLSYRKWSFHAVRSGAPVWADLNWEIRLFEIILPNSIDSCGSFQLRMSEVPLVDFNSWINIAERFYQHLSWQWVCGECFIYSTLG